jgi:acid phosphatase (class A)
MAGIYYNVRTTPADSTYAAYRKNLFHIGHSIGTWFNPDNLPVTANFMAHVWQDASYYIWKYKYKFLRVRPYVLEPALQNLEETNWAAYPSGHAANSYVNAFIYSMLAPEFTDVFLKDAYDMAHSREIIGVHYPSDSEVSRELAHQLVKALLENDKFKRDFEEVKKEWSLKAKESFEKPQITPKTDKKKESCAKTCE